MAVRQKRAVVSNPVPRQSTRSVDEMLHDLARLTISGPGKRAEMIAVRTALAVKLRKIERVEALKMIFRPSDVEDLVRELRDAKAASTRTHTARTVYRKNPAKELCLVIEVRPAKVER